MVISGVSGYLALTYLLQSASPVVVPQMVGKDVVYALELLTDLGLNTKVQGSEYSESVPKHHITFQAPEPGAEIKKGRAVSLVISKGPRRVFMPNLTGLSNEQAQVILADNGLNQGYLTHTYHTQAPTNGIIAQSPLAGETVMRQAEVNLLVSKGPAPRRIRMPSLIDLSTHEALDKLNQHQIQVGLFKTVRRETVAPNIVLSQTPLHGYPASTTDRIVLAINQSPATQETARTPFKLKEGVGLYRHRTQPGFLKPHIRVMLSGYGALTTLLDDFVKPGEEIWVLVPHGNQITLFVHEDDELIETRLFE